MLKFTGYTNEVLEGANILFADRTENLTINIKKEGIGLKIDRNGDDICISYNKKSEFFRAVLLLLEDYAENREVYIHQTPKFKTIGVMPDCAFGALKVEAVKDLIRYMARMGMNFLMLYTEECYEVKEFPYYGYMRGRYSQAELRECDEYADIFGIEMIPCIQTLAHLQRCLRWSYTDEIKDTDNILLVGEEKTYEFLEKIILAASAPFKSKRIHLGLDEAKQLGLGKYLQKNGYHDQKDIFREHLQKLVKIVKKAGLQPMMWSDMYLSGSSSIGDMYDPDLVVPDEVIDAAPCELELVYWDYYHEDKEAYRKAIDLHKRFKAKTIFAGGIWLWDRLVPHHEKTMTTAKIALEVCKEKEVDEVIATIWGSSTNIYTALPGMQIYAEYSYQDEVTDEFLEKRFYACTHEDFNAFADITKLDYICDTKADVWHTPSNPSTFLLWQNIMMGLYDKNVEGTNTHDYYEKIAEEMDVLLQKTKFKNVFTYYKELALVLSLKADIGVRIKAAYDVNDKAELKNIADKVLPEIEKRLNSLKETHLKIWTNTHKPFGWERFDVTYGSIAACCNTAIFRINAYLSGEIDILEEMEEDRLYLGKKDPNKSGLSRYSFSFANTFSPIGIR